MPTDADLIYLACPYSHPFAHIKQKRAHIATQVAAKLHDQGHLVYSPITYSAEVELYSTVRQGWEYWRCLDYIVLDEADWLYILRLDGWRESVGVTEEIHRFAGKMKKKGIKFIYPEDYGVRLCDGITLQP